MAIPYTLGTISEISGQIVLVTHDGSVHPHVGEILSPTGLSHPIPLEVYAFRDETSLYALCLGNNDLLVRGMQVTGSGKSLQLPVGEQLLGRVIDMFGSPLDGGEPLRTQTVQSIYTDTLNFKETITDTSILETGIKQIDFFTPFIRGGKMGMIGGAGVGKTILLTEILKNILSVHEGVAVFAGIGERIREGHELYHSLKESDVLKKTALIFGQMNENAAIRFRTAWSATTLAQYFRDVAHQDVLFFVDNVYRFIQAGSELSTLIQQIPSEMGYQPTLETDVGTFQSRLSSTKQGFITSVQNIYVPADQIDDPGVKAIMGYLDSSVVLSRSRAALNLYPPIDPFLSSSTNLNRSTIGDEHFEVVTQTKQLLTEFERVSRIVAIIGEQELTAENQVMFKRGKLIQNYLTQPFSVTEQQTGKKGVRVARATTVKDIAAILQGALDNVPLENVLYIGSLEEANIVK